MVHFSCRFPVHFYMLIDRYDDLYRLVTADNPVLSDEGFSYDPVGNRITDTQYTGSWTYNDNNELISAPFATFTIRCQWQHHRQDRKRYVVWTYTYNLEDRMISAESNIDDCAVLLRSIRPTPPQNRKRCNHILLLCR